MTREAYDIDLVPLEGTDQYWLTVDLPDEKYGMKSDVIQKFKGKSGKEKGIKMLKEIRSQYTLTKNPFTKKDYMDKSVRDHIASCKEKKIDYKQALLKKMILGE